MYIFIFEHKCSTLRHTPALQHPPRRFKTLQQHTPIHSNTLHHTPLHTPSHTLQLTPSLSPPPKKNTQLLRDLPNMATRVESMLDPLSQRVRAVKQRQMSLGSANTEVRRLRSAMHTWHAQLEQGGKSICVCVWIFTYLYMCATAAIGCRYLANSA